MKYIDFFKEVCSLKGGKSDNKKPSPLYRSELSMGIKTEKEHTKDHKLAKKIAMDHLVEDPHYYSKLRSAGLADELNENDLMGLMAPMSVFPNKQDNKGIVEPDTNNVDKQTSPGTVYPKVDSDPMKGPDMSGCIGNTNAGNSGVEVKSDVDSPSKDPTPTDHVTGGIGNSPSNSNILSKNQPFTDLGGGSQMMTMAQQALGKQPMGQDIEIDIAEGKKLLKKMMKETTTSPSIKGAATAFSPKEGFVPAAGDPDKDDHFVKGKRWTVNYGKKTPTIENK